MINKIENLDLGHSYFYIENENGRLFLASQVMKEFGYSGGLSSLTSLELILNQDVFKFTKKDYADVFVELTRLNLVGHRASEVVLLSESGFWKLTVQSKKPIGIKTRHWLSSEVLPSIRKTGSYSIAENSPLADFTERKTQIGLSKDVNGIIHKTAKDSSDYAKFWNELHTIVTGMTAKEIQEFYKSKGSAKEVLRIHAPHLEATEAVIEDLWKKGVGLDKIKDSGLHEDLSNSFKKILAFGIDLKTLGK